jgi:glycosyltransferase involved in cell wall biosynthesis
MRKVLFITCMTSYPWGGSEKLWSQAAEQLHARGCEVWSSQGSISRGHSEAIRLSEIGILTTFRKPKPRSGFFSVLRRLYRRVFPEDARLLARVGPDIVIISQGNNKEGLLWMELCKRQGIPYATVVQCNSETWFLKECQRLRLRGAYQSACAVYCVSKQNLELLQNQLACGLPNASVVFNPQKLDQEDVLAWPKESENVRIACVARIELIAKAQDVLIQIMALAKWRERNVVLSLYGSGPDEGAIRELIGFMEVQNVCLRGQVRSYQDIWAENELLVMPSRYEGMSLALLESMWCGRPSVVAATGGGACEVVEDGKSGFIAEAPTVKLFDAAMERAWKSRALWPEMGKCAREIGEERIPADPSAVFAETIESLML